MPSGRVVATAGILDPGREIQTITKHYSKCFVEAYREINGRNSG
jgi:hypothetical protein